jgi:hypothetical protein
MQLLPFHLLVAAAALPAAFCYPLPAIGQQQQSTSSSRLTISSADQDQQAFTKRSPFDDDRTLIPARELLQMQNRYTQYGNVASSSGGSNTNDYFPSAHTSHAEMAEYHSNKLLDIGVDYLDTIDQELVVPWKVVEEESRRHARKAYQSGKEYRTGVRHVDNGDGRVVEERVPPREALTNLAIHGAQAGLYGTASAAGRYANMKLNVNLMAPYQVLKMGKHSVLALSHTALHHAPQLSSPACTAGTACKKVVSQSKKCVGGVCGKVANAIKSVVSTSANPATPGRNGSGRGRVREGPPPRVSIV